MKGEETGQRRKEGRAKNPERSKQRAKHKATQNESRAPTREMVEEELLPPVIPGKRLPEKKPPMPKPGDESSFSIALQVPFPYLLAGLGMVLAGMVLDVVQMYIPQGTAPEERTSS